MFNPVLGAFPVVTQRAVPSHSLAPVTSVNDSGAREQEEDTQSGVAVVKAITLHPATVASFEK